MQKAKQVTLLDSTLLRKHTPQKKTVAHGCPQPQLDTEQGLLAVTSWGSYESEYADKQASTPHRYPPQGGINLTLAPKSPKKPVVAGGVRVRAWALVAELLFSMG